MERTLARLDRKGFKANRIETNTYTLRGRYSILLRRAEIVGLKKETNEGDAPFYYSHENVVCLC